MSPGGRPQKSARTGVFCERAVFLRLRKPRMRHLWVQDLQAALRRNASTAIPANAVAGRPKASWLRLPARC